MEKEKEKAQQKNKLASFARFISLFLFLCFLSFIIFLISEGDFYDSGIEFYVSLASTLIVIFFGYSSYILFRTKKDEVSKKVGYLLIYLIRIGILCLLFFMYRIFTLHQGIIIHFQVNLDFTGKFINWILVAYITIIALIILYFSFKLRKKENFFKSLFIIIRKLLLKNFYILLAIIFLSYAYPIVSNGFKHPFAYLRLILVLLPLSLLILFRIIVIKFLRFKFTEAIVRSKILFIFTFILSSLRMLLFVNPAGGSFPDGAQVMSIILFTFATISLIGSISGFIIYIVRKVRKKKEQNLNIEKIDNK